MPENKKIKIKDETDKTLYEVKLDTPSESKKMNPVLKAFLLNIVSNLSQNAYLLSLGLL